MSFIVLFFFQPCFALESIFQVQDQILEEKWSEAYKGLIEILQKPDPLTARSALGLYDIVLKETNGLETLKLERDGLRLEFYADQKDGAWSYWAAIFDIGKSDQPATMHISGPSGDMPFFPQSDGVYSTVPSSSRAPSGRYKLSVKRGSNTKEFTFIRPHNIPLELNGKAVLKEVKLTIEFGNFLLPSKRSHIAVTVVDQKTNKPEFHRNLAKPEPLTIPWPHNSREKYLYIGASTVLSTAPFTLIEQSRQILSPR